MDETDPKPNERKFKMVPAVDIEKDPYVGYSTDSENGWLFVKIDKSGNFDNYMTYAIAEGWTLLSGITDTVYYKQVIVKDVPDTTPKINEAGNTFYTWNILKDDKVSVKETVTKEMMNSLNANNYPTLTFTAYAVQLEAADNAADAWAARPTT